MKNFMFRSKIGGEQFVSADKGKVTITETIKTMDSWISLSIYLAFVE